jgi:glycosyltransferase involved in cell wall biosynthesis
VIPAILLKLLKRLHLAVWVQDIWPESLFVTGYVRNKFILFIVSLLVRWIYACSDTLLLQSNAFREPLSRYVDIDKLVYFPNSVDVEFQSKSLAVLPKELSELMAKKFCIVFAGNIGRAQAVNTIVQTALLLRDKADISIVMVGSGSMFNAIQEQKKVLNLDNLVLPGRFSTELMAELYRKASALLVTLNRDKGLMYTVPSKVQTYLAVGCPIIGSLQGESAKIILAAGAGFVCEPENPQALADCICRLHDLPEDCRMAMGKRGRFYFDKNFNMSRQVGLLVEILELRKKGKKKRKSDAFTGSGR